MAKYKFPQFEITIENPVVSILEPHLEYPSLGKISLNVLLETSSAKKKVLLEDISCINTYTADLMQLVLAKLDKYKIE
ncbi:hypothetical protein [Brumimicrobium mesophilum]|uniref:hypothetical protein n=1 Tax=Brumimicrobium mesophilum TaxID=392717 RepID=UPI00131D197B|nr:hypothetical protein [Brumimicrobium mesophilum]